MFRNTFQSGFLSILYSLGSKPLQIWDAQGEPSQGKAPLARFYQHRVSLT